MAYLSGETHGDAASKLMGYYLRRSRELEDADQYFMSAVSLAFAVEASLLAYLLVEFGPNNGGWLMIPDNVGFSDLIRMANEVDVLSAPISIASHAREGGAKPKHLGKDVVDNLRKFRNLIHPAAALKRGFDPESFTKS